MVLIIENFKTHHTKIYITDKDDLNLDADFHQK